MAKIVIAITGQIASGKGTVAKYIKNNYNAKTYRFSSPLRDILDRLYQQITRESLADISLRLRQAYGEQILSKVICEDIKRDDNKIVVIDGVRRQPDIKFIKNLEGFKLVFVETNLENRYQRIIKRGENTDDNNKSFEQFKKDNQLETEQQIVQLEAKANYIVENNGSFRDLYRQIDQIMDLLI